MDRQEFIKKYTELTREIKLLKEEYITSNVDILPGTFVLISCEGMHKEKFYLKEYHIVDGYIRPIFNKCYNGVPLRFRKTQEDFPNNIVMEKA